jgi:eukaryotic-like serine/threonine-protein kinase
MSVHNDRIIGIGQDLGPYRIEALLGTGGMGIVYRARHLQLERTVAIKMVDRGRSKADSERWLLQEARLAAALNHPCICNVHDIGYVGDQPFIVMEHVEGTLLSALIPAGQGFPVGTALHYALQIADAVAHAHGRGIVHRDLKSSNIIVGPDGRVKLLDFGLAVRTNADASELDTTGSKEMPSEAGTVPYMAPELLRGRPADRRSDVWALGVLVHEMLTGRRPFVGATRYELAAAILGDPVVPLAREVPAGWRSVVARSLMKDPAERYQCAREVSAALDDLV